MQKLKMSNVENRLAQKEETFLELKALAKGRHAQLRAANRAVQIIKVELRVRDRLFEERIYDMRSVNDQKVALAKGIKRDREFLVPRYDTSCHQHHIASPLTNTSPHLTLPLPLPLTFTR